MTTPAAVLEARARLGWPQHRLAEALGIAPNTVARWERGEKRPPPYLLLALDRLLWLHRLGPLDGPP